MQPSKYSYGLSILTLETNSKPTTSKRQMWDLRGTSTHRSTSPRIFKCQSDEINEVEWYPRGKVITNDWLNYLNTAEFQDSYKYVRFPQEKWQS